MLTFIALYRGDSANDAKMVAVTADRDLVSAFAERLLGNQDPSHDPVLAQLEHGRSQALRLIAREGKAVQR